MRDEDKGQVTIEFLLVVGAMIIIAIVGVPITLKNAEMNRGLSAARDGATFGASMRGLGFSSSGGNEGGLVRIESITSTVTEISGSQDNVSITINADISGGMNNVSVCDTIETQAQRYTAYALTGQWPSGATVPLADRTGSYYAFIIGCAVLP